MAKYKLTMRDNSREVSQSAWNIDPIDVSNIGDILTAVGIFRGAVEAITLGVAAKEALVMDETNLSGLAPTSTLAQRGVKWTVQYIDITEYFDVANAIPNAGYQQSFTNTIATADLTLLVSGAEDMVLTSGPGAAFKVAFDNLIKSPYGGSVSLQRVYYTD